MANLYIHIDKLRLVCESEKIDFNRLIKEAFNVRESEIDNYNNIRICNPCESHWLNNDEMTQLISYVNNKITLNA